MDKNEVLEILNQILDEINDLEEEYHDMAADDECFGVINDIKRIVKRKINELNK